MSSEISVPAVYEGGCHCGAVRLRIRVSKHEAVACNCSICAKKGFLGVVVAPGDFELLAGEDALETYRFNTGVAQHRFCRTCGIHPFSRPRSHPDAYYVNLRCLDGDVLERFALREFDGQHWEEHIDEIR